MTVTGLILRATAFAVATQVAWKPVQAAAQGTAPPVGQVRQASIYRPWVGMGAGLGGVLGATGGGTDGLLASSLDLPVSRRDSIRFSAERLWSEVEGYGGLSLKQFSVDLFVRKPTGTAFGCSMYTVLGLGPGIYNISLESEEVADATRVGYQLTIGQECIRSRVATGGGFGFRFVKMPDHPAFANALDVAMTLSLSLRIRL